MSNPDTVNGREVIIGGGAHAAIYAATRNALGKPRPIVIEERSVVGGIFARTVPFAMNSANDASVASVEAGPSRLIRKSTSDDINYLPNSKYQVRDYDLANEYPRSDDMATIIRRTLREYADVYTESYVTANDGDVYGYSDIEKTSDSTYLGYAKRIIFATGLKMSRQYEGKAVMTAETFLAEPINDYRDKRVAIVGNGDTAATVAEFLTGQGISKPFTRPDSIDWYGDFNMPTTKERWALDYHARYIGLARHFPESKVTGVIQPYTERGTITSLGGIALVNGRIYDHVIDATGFKPYVPATGITGRFTAQSRVLALWDFDRRFVIGAAADLGEYIAPVYENRFSASRAALYNLAPLTAALAASLD